ncbi:MAG TPA: hypothetical protein VH560_14515, partial [Polyangia bacterium]|nr:hypothetical protein [Polyangia bacterium]
MIAPSASFVTALLAAAVSLPGGPPVGMDYLAYDAATDRVWVPAGNTGNVDVVDAATGTVSMIVGLPTAPARRPDRPRMGPSSATVADGIVWIGDRADQRLRSYNAKTLRPGSSAGLAAMPDGIQYVRRTHELWVTTPSDRSIAIVRTPHGGNGSNTLRPSATIKLPGAPEGYAVDEARGVFYT